MPMSCFNVTCSVEWNPTGAKLPHHVAPSAVLQAVASHGLCKRPYSAMVVPGRTQCKAGIVSHAKSLLAYLKVTGNMHDDSCPTFTRDIPRYSPELEASSLHVYLRGEQQQCQMYLTSLLTRKATLKISCQTPSEAKNLAVKVMWATVILRHHWACHGRRTCSILPPTALYDRG